MVPSAVASFLCLSVFNLHHYMFLDPIKRTSQMIVYSLIYRRLQGEVKVLRYFSKVIDMVADSRSEKLRGIFLGRGLSTITMVGGFIAVVSQF